MITLIFDGFADQVIKLG